MQFSLITLALIFCIFLFAGSVKGLIGLGLPTVAIALLINTIPARDAVPFMVVPAIGTNIWQAVTGGHGIPLLKRFWLLLLLVCVGTWVGVGVLAAGNQQLIGGVFGAILMVYALTSLYRPAPIPIGSAEPWLSPIIGFLNGIMNGLTGSYVIPGVVYLQALRLGRDEMIQAMGISFLVSSLALGISLGGHAVMGWAHLAISAAALVPSLAGYAIGQHFRRKLPQERFRKVFFIGLLCLGAYTFITHLFF